MDENRDVVNDKKKKISAPVHVTVIVLSVIIIVLSCSFYYFYSLEQENMEIPKVKFSKFPKLDVRLTHTDREDRILLYHLEGNTLDLTRYKIIITNVSDYGDQASLTTLDGELDNNEMTIFSNITYTEMNDVKFEVGNAYDVEIYEIKGPRRLLIEEMVCEAGIEK